jgi:hypothetical protein
MPIEHSETPSSFKRNVRTLMHEVGKSPHVQSRAQALAVAYATQRRAKHRDMGGAATTSDPVQAVINALQQGGGFGAAANGSNPLGNATNATPAPTATALAPAASPPAVSGLMPATAIQAPTTPASAQPAPTAGAGIGAAQAPASVVSGLQPATAMQAPTTPANPASFSGAPAATAGLGAVNGQTVPQNQNPAAFAAGGMASPPWYQRAESREMLHTGPVMSAVPGRTDRHSISVPSGSYVVPSEEVGHLGEGNTMAGMSVLGRMFGSAPGGASMPRIGHGMGLPRPPKPMGLMDAGGSRGEGGGEGVPVIVAGGEYIIGPDSVRAIGNGNIKHGHQALDAWIMSMRKEHQKTLSKLKPPVKS